MKRIALFAFLAACSNATSAPPDATIGASPDAAAPGPDADTSPLGTVVINEVAAAGSPNDWFEIVNASSATVTLSDYEFVDSSPIAMAKHFADGVTLAPNQFYVQEVTDAGNGFKLGSDEALYLYRVADGRLSDGVDWTEGASPAGGSYARVPDMTGAFQTVMPDTRGVPNE